MSDYISPIEMVVNSVTKSKYEEINDYLMLSVEREIGFKVDKEELIKALEYDRKQYEKGFEDGLKSAVDWIPVSERLPEEGGRYLVYTWGHEIEIVKYVDGFWNIKTPISAWMPLPLPYKQEVEE